MKKDDNAVKMTLNTKFLNMPTLDIRNAITNWETLTFKEWVNRTHWTDKTVRLELSEQLEALGLLDKKINGYSVMGLEQTQEGFGSGGVSYTDTFFKMVETTGGCNLIDYLYLIVKVSLEKEFSESKIRGVLARAMRTYASLLRDHDFAHEIEREIKERKVSDKFKVSSGSIEDSQNHTDVLITSKNNNYRIWLYQFSRRGIPHDIERLTELRGKLPSGVHVLCPLKSEYQRDLEAVSYSISVATKRLITWKETLRATKSSTKFADTLNNRILVNTQKLEQYKAEEAELKRMLNGNILSHHGWYLYGDIAVKETLETIINVEKKKIEPRPYNEVYKMLIAPKEFLSQLSTFRI